MTETTELVIFIIISAIILSAPILAICYVSYKESNKEVYYIAFCEDKEGKKEYGKYPTIYFTFKDAEASMYTRGWKYHVVPISKGVGQWKEGNKLEEDYLVVKTKKKKDI